MRSCVILQSGGPTAVINSSLYGVIKANSKDIDVKLFGSKNGIEGLINDDLISVDKINNIDLLINTPGALLGSSRHKLSSDFNDEDYKKIVTTIKKNNIGYILLNGGNDSMDSGNKLYKYFKVNDIDVNVIGIPKTIDNDLLYLNSCPGYGSAIKYIATTINELKLDTSVYKKGRVTIVEIMGRDAGWLTAGSKLASLNNLGPDLIYLPESSFDLDKFLDDVKRLYEKNKKVLVAISEGIKDKNGNYILDLFNKINNSDNFGHTQLGGVANNLASYVKEKLNLPVRSIELNLMQRAAGHYLSKNDVDLAISFGKKAYQYMKKHTGKMVCSYLQDNKVKFGLVDLNKVANKIRYFPSSWIVDGNDISKEYILYALPLIKGNIPLTYEDNLIKYSSLS